MLLQCHNKMLPLFYYFDFNHNNILYPYLGANVISAGEAGAITVLLKVMEKYIRIYDVCKSASYIIKRLTYNGP